MDEANLAIALAVAAEREACVQLLLKMASRYAGETGDMYQDNENEAARNALCLAISAIMGRAGSKP